MKTRVFELYVETNTYSMAELAELLGYAPSYLSRIRHGRAPVSNSFITRCCMKLGHSIQELFYEEELTT